jgi:uncharacterized protein (TIGR04255 family)
MAKQRHLPNAPVTEALIDLRVSRQEALTFTKLQTAFGKLDFGYYLKNPISEGTFAFKIAPSGIPETETESAQVGLRLHSTNEKYVAQFTLHGFTLSRLPPYENWGNLLYETHRLWSIYLERLAPIGVTRVATRYINDLRLPLQAGMSYETYLQKFVDIPDEVPQAVEGFFQRFQVVDQETGARLVLTLSLQGSSPGGPMPIILDLDAYIATELDPKDESLWDKLEHLHDLKNRGFFGTITEQAAELYE